MTPKQQQGEIAKGIAVNMRQALHTAFPGVRFRVIHRGYGNSYERFPYISIHWHKDGPEESAVQAICDPFKTPKTQAWYERSQF